MRNPKNMHFPFAKSLTFIIRAASRLRKINKNSNRQKDAKTHLQKGTKNRCLKQCWPSNLPDIKPKSKQICIEKTFEKDVEKSAYLTNLKNLSEYVNATCNTFEDTAEQEKSRERGRRQEQIAEI